MADNHGNIVDRLSSLVDGLKEQRRVQRETESDEDINECLSRLFPSARSTTALTFLLNVLFFNTPGKTGVPRSSIAAEEAAHEKTPGLRFPDLAPLVSVQYLKTSFICGNKFFVKKF